MIGRMFCVAVFVMSMFSAAGAAAARVELFSPQGTVRDVRQVTARFTDQMVPFGDPRADDPFDISCPAEGTGRWVDEKNWAYDFKSGLPAGTACTFTLKKGLKTAGQAAVGGQRSFTFNTGGPAVRDTEPFEGSEDIDERQTFIFRLDGEADEASVARHVSCSIEGIRERVGVQIITGEERQRFFSALGASPRQRDTVLFRCRQAFPPGAHVKIIWGKGVASKGSLIATSQDQVFPYRARGPFTARFACMRERPQGGCIPLSPMRLYFSSPISAAQAEAITMVSEKRAGGATWRPRRDAEAGNFVEQVTFSGPFPEKSSFAVHVPRGLKDISGRPLSSAGTFPLTVRTDTYPALAKFPDRFGIIESKEKPLLPVTVRNIEEEIKTWLAAGETSSSETAVEQSVKGALHRAGEKGDEAVIDWLQRLRDTPRERPVLAGVSKGEPFSVGRPGGSKEFEVIGIPLDGPGFYVVEIESLMLGKRLLNKSRPVYVPTGALVTNMAAHLKLGRASSLVFVTALDSGEPVPGATVTLRDCRGGMVWQGAAGDDGIARIDEALPDAASLPVCPSGSQEKDLRYEYSRVLSGIGEGLFVFARKGQDMTFTHSSWDDGIEYWRYNVPYRYEGRGDGLIAHTVFDRTLLQAGETVHMKHFVRKRTMEGLFVPSGLDAIRESVIVHIGSGEKYALALSWKENGTAESEWKIPSGAKLGVYNVYLRTDGKEEGSRELSGSFRVEAFRVPLMRGFLRGPGDPVVAAGSVDVDADLRHLSGGGAGGHPVRVRAEIERRQVLFDGLEGFIFSSGKVRTGIERFGEGRYDPYGEDPAEDGEAGQERAEREATDWSGNRKIRLRTTDLDLDRNGAARITFTGLPKIDAPHDIVSELEFRDPNGEVQTVSARIPFYPAALHVGLFSVTGDYVRDVLRYQVVVVDLEGRPVEGAKVTTRVFKRSTYSHRRRITGGFYAYEHITETKDIGEDCTGTTGAGGILYCENPAKATGRVVIEARVIDGGGRAVYTSREFALFGEEDVWFGSQNDDRIELIPEKRFVEAGETIRLQVRMPFREAMALVTVEREGIMDAYVRRVTRDDPFVEIPVKANYTPNVFVSALVVRGRVAGTVPSAMFDPGKPAYKLGIAEVGVGWKSHTLKVNVSTDKKEYTVRETVRARVAVRGPSGSSLQKGSEATIAVVDEGLLELGPNESWSILEGMMRRKGCETVTATAQMMVVGKRHFGRKAMPHGGGGGKQLTRELFDTLVFWKATVALDEKGEAEVSFPLNDSLTSFRIVAVVNSGDLFGTGESAVRTSQELMVLPGLPALAREGDRFTAGFTLRNTSKRDMEVTAVLTMTDKGSRRRLEPAATLTIPAGGSGEAQWPVTVPSGAEKVDYEVSARENRGAAGDTVKVTQKVVPAVTPRVFQATTARLTDTLSIGVETPAGALPGKGGIFADVRPAISGSLQGVADHMRRYPYVCLEQTISKAVALRSRDMWDAVMEEVPSYLDGDGLAKYFPLMARGSDTLTSYILSVAEEAGYAIPEKTRTKMLEGLKRFVEGKVLRYSSIRTADLSIRKLAAAEALARHRQFSPRLLTTIDIAPGLWPTSAVLDWISLLQRSRDITEREKKLEEAGVVLRSRLALQGTIMGFSTERTDALWWLMVTADLNAARTLSASMELAGWEKDVPRILQGLLGRMKRGRWDTTAANAWGVLAVEKFSKKYESVPVTGVSSVSMGSEKVAIQWSEKEKGMKAFFPMTAGKGTVLMEHRGGGSPWVTLRSVAAVPLKAPLSSGYAVRKTMVPVEQKVQNKWSRGDLIRVRLEMEAQSDMTWVAVSDPIPAGSVVLGSGLGRDPGLVTSGERQTGWVAEAFRERTHEGLRVYYEFVPKGRWTVEYTLRLNNDGIFRMPETRVEALYAPEMFGEAPNGTMEIGR